MISRLRQVTTRAALLLLWLTLLTACGGDQPVGPTSPPDSSGAQATATTGTSSNPTAATPVQGNGSLTGIDLSRADPCALLTREEAEAIMGPLDWKPTPHELNDPTFWLKCQYDTPFPDVTPDKSLAVRVIAPNLWPDSYDHLQVEGKSRVPRQDVGLAAEAAVRHSQQYVPFLLPELCDSELPCVIANEGGQLDRMTLLVIMADQSAIQIEINPRNVDYTTQFARKILERLPMK